MMRRATVGLLLWCCLPGCSGAPAGGTGIEARIAERLGAFDAKTTFYAKHLPTGTEIGIRADEPVNTLSVIKITVLVQAYRDVDGEKLNLDERYTVKPEDMRRGSGVLQDFDAGLQPTYRDLLTQMIITSDNVATDVLIKKLGRDRINETLAGLGYRETRLQGTVGQRYRRRWELLDPKYASLTDRAVFEMGFPRDPGARDRNMAMDADPREWFGRTTAREISRLFVQIHNGEVASRASCDQMIDILKRQESTSRLPRRIRFQGAEVAHKTGDSPPIVANDVGIIYYEGGPAVVSIFANQNRSDFEELEAAMGRIAEDLIMAWR